MTQSSLSESAYMLESTVRSIFFQSARRWINSYTLPRAKRRVGRSSVRVELSGMSQAGAALFRSERAAVARGVADDLGKILRVLDDVDVANHLEVREVVGNAAEELSSQRAASTVGEEAELYAPLLFE
jgi:hypothetical protein